MMLITLKNENEEEMRGIKDLRKGMEIPFKNGDRYLKVTVVRRKEEDATGRIYLKGEKTDYTYPMYFDEDRGWCVEKAEVLDMRCLVEVKKKRRKRIKEKPLEDMPFSLDPNSKYKDIWASR